MATHCGNDAARRRQTASTTIGAGGIAFLLSQFITSIGNFGFHLVAARLLGPAGYGLLGSMLVFFAVLAVPVAACGTILTAAVARYRERGLPVDSRLIMRHSVTLGILICVALMLVAPFSVGYLHVPSAWPLVCVGLYAMVLTTGTVPWAILCGHRRFAAVGIAGTGGMALRFGLIVVFIHLGWGVSGALAATLLAEAARTAMMWRTASRSASTAGVAAPRLRLPARDALSGTAAITALWMLLGIDTMLARHLFDPATAGRYAAAATLSQSAFFVIQTGCVLALPRFVGDHAARALRAVSASGLIAGLLVTAGLVATRPLLAWIFGSAYLFDPLVVALLCLGATCLGLLWILVQCDLARGHSRRRSATLPWIGVVVTLMTGSIWHPGPVGLAASMLVSVVAVTGIAALDGRNRAPSVRPYPVSTGASRLLPEVDLTVVVPFYNPGDLLRPNLLSLVESLRAAGATFEVITVEDGCTDGSPASIADLDPATVRRLSLPRNSGKGAALRVGLCEGRGRYVGFIDADGDIDPALWRPFLGLVRLYEPDVIIGSKRHPLSEIGSSVTWTRRWLSRGYQAMVRLLFPMLPVNDTQVGIKVFRRELLAEVLPLTVERRFVFDLELLIVAWRRGYRRIMPAPVTLGRQGPSTVTFRAVWYMLIDTLALAWRMYGRAAYHAEHERSGAPGDDRIPVPLGEPI